MLLPLQGAIAAANLPRALPWAMRLLSLQPAPRALRNIAPAKGRLLQIAAF